MTYLDRPVAYLQNDDFDSDGNIINPDIPDNTPIVIMLQANFCGHCTKAKGDFQEFANNNKGKIFCATIQGDGNEKGESELAKRLSSMYKGFVGYPTYVGYRNKKSKYKMHDGGRDSKSLQSFSSSL